MATTESCRAGSSMKRRTPASNTTEARENLGRAIPDCGGCMSNDDTSGPMSRRAVLKSATAAAAAVATTSLEGSATAGPAASKGRVKQSLVHWCYSKYWEPQQLAEV